MANDEFRSPVVIPAPTLDGHPATKEYVDDAVAAGGGGGLPSGWVDVADHGAVGDNTADDTAELQAAIDALPASGGVLHLAPNATYKISADLVAPAYGLIIDGNGSAIRQVTTTEHGITGVDITGLVLRDLTLIGPDTGSGKGIYLSRSTNPAIPKLHFERVVVRDFGGDGIELSNPITSFFANVEARSNGAHGWNVHGVTAGAAGTSCSFIACYADANGKAGFRLENMVYSAFLGGAADHNGIQYELVDCQGITFAGCGCETPVNRTTGYVGDSWKINGGFGIVLDGCWSFEQLTTSVYVTGAAKGVIIKGFVENSPQGAATHCVKTDASTRVTIVDANNVKPYSLAGGTTSILNDGGGLSVPGYVYGAGTAYFEGDVGTSAGTPANDASLVPRGWVNTQLGTRALDSAVVHNTGNENIGGQKTIPSGAGNQWIFNIAPQVAVGTLANQPVRRDDARVTADQAAATASIRTLGTGALQATAGDDARLSDARTPVAHNHAGADINSGTVAFARLPTGTSSSTVSIGDHTHGGGGSLTGYTQTIGAISAGGSLVITHNLGSRYVIAQVARVGTPYDIVDIRIERTSINTVTLLPDVAMSAAVYEIMIVKVA